MLRGLRRFFGFDSAEEDELEPSLTTLSSGPQSGAFRVGEKLSIKGEIVGEGDLELAGRFEGIVNVNGRVHRGGAGRGGCRHQRVQHRRRGQGPRQSERDRPGGDSSARHPDGEPQERELRRRRWRARQGRDRRGSRERTDRGRGRPAMRIAAGGVADRPGVRSGLGGRAGLRERQPAGRRPVERGADGVDGRRAGRGRAGRGGRALARRDAAQGRAGDPGNAGRRPGQGPHVPGRDRGEGGRAPVVSGDERDRRAAAGQAAALRSRRRRRARRPRARDAGPERHGRRRAGCPRWRRTRIPDNRQGTGPPPACRTRP